MFNQKFTSQELLGVLLIHRVAPHYTILYNINKYKAIILKGYDKNENNNTKNLTAYWNYIGNVSIGDNKTMVSFDIISFHTFLKLMHQT